MGIMPKTNAPLKSCLKKANKDYGWEQKPIITNPRHRLYAQSQLNKGEPMEWQPCPVWAAKKKISFGYVYTRYFD